MWIFFPNAMLSIVAHRDKPDTLLVRARFKGDIERVFGWAGVKVQRTPRADYLYRAEVRRQDVATALNDAAWRLEYTNVKGAIPDGDHRRSRAMHDIWQVMFDAQHAAEPFQGLDAAEEDDARPLPPVLTDAWYAHTTARGEPRTVHVEQVQERSDGGAPDVSLVFQESGARF